MRMHNPPDIEFKRDKGFERADRIARVLDKIQGDRAQGAGHGEDTPATGESGAPEGDGDE